MCLGGLGICLGGRGGMGWLFELCVLGEGVMKEDILIIVPTFILGPAFLQPFKGRSKFTMYRLVMNL